MAVHPLRPATDRRFGGPLPRQLPNQTRIHPIPPEFFTLYHAVPCAYAVLSVVSNCYPPCMGQVIHALLTRPPLRITTSTRGLQKQFSVRLACVKHAASVHPEPGSNSQKMCLFQVQHKLTSLHIPFYCFKGSFDRSLNVSVFPDCLIKEFSRIVFMCFTV